MGEVLVINWSREQIELRQVPSEGVWPVDISPLKTSRLERATRVYRLKDSDSGERLSEALANLFTTVEITLPVWLLVPHDWVLTFHIDNPELQPPELRRAHLLWEVQQRLHGDITNFRVLFSADDTSPHTDVQVVRGEVLDAFTWAVTTAGLEIAGLVQEPAEGSHYSFELPFDLREAVPVDLVELPPMKAPTTFPPVVMIGLGVVVIAVAGYLLLIPSGKERPSKEAKPEPTPAVVAEMGKPVDESPVTKVPAEPAPPVQQKVSPVVSEGVSPLSLMAQTLPAGARVELAVLSPVDFRAEISGIKDPGGWIADLRRSDMLKSIRRAGGYSSDRGDVVVVRLERLGWNPGAGARDLDSWTSRAGAVGLKARGRSAKGKFEAVLDLIDAMWTDSDGFTKILVAPDDGRWLVTVQ